MRAVRLQSLSAQVAAVPLKNRLCERSKQILAMLSQGSTEAEILAVGVAASRYDVMRAAREALVLHEAVRKYHRRTAKILRQYPRAFEKWCAEEERRIVDMHGAGKTLREIARVVKRRPQAVKNRLERLQKSQR